MKCSGFEGQSPLDATYLECSEGKLSALSFAEVDLFESLQSYSNDGGSFSKQSKDEDWMPDKRVQGTIQDTIDISSMQHTRSFKGNVMFMEPEQVNLDYGFAVEFDNIKSNEAIPYTREEKKILWKKYKESFEKRCHNYKTKFFKNCPPLSDDGSS